MPIDATCPHCKQTFQVPDSAAGKRFKCRNCSQPMDVPTAEEIAAAKAAPADDEIEIDEIEDDDDEAEADDASDDDADDEADADDESDEDGDDGSEDADEDADDEDADEDGEGKKLSARDRLKAKREGKKDKKKDKDEKKKDKKDKDKADKAEKKASKLAAFAGSSEGVNLSAAGDPSESFGDALAAIQRAMSPSRLVLSMGGVAAAVFAMVVLGWLFMELMMATEQAWMRFLIYGSMAIGGAGILFAASAVARVDLAQLRGEEAPGPIKALLKAWMGWIPGLVPSLIIAGVAWLLMFQAEYWIGKVTGVAYIGPILLLPIGFLFFLINAAILIFAPLSLWLAIPVGAGGGLNPIGPLLETLGRIRREPGRIFLSYIVFALLVALIFGVISWVLFMAAGIAAGNMSGFSLSGSLMGGGGGGGDANFFQRMLGAIFGGGLAAVLFGFIIGPFLSAFVCGGCQEVAKHPYES